jgi:predicted RNase H-like HicB family nuclease
VSRRIAVALEVTPKKAFATAVDWPGWSRSGKTPELALEALSDAAPLYASVAEEAGETLPSGVDASDFDVVEEAEGGSGTVFGVPSRITDADRRPVTAKEADRLRRLVAAAWTTFDRVAASAPAELRKGPRGGGRDRDKMIGHVIESDDAYAREIGLRLKPTVVGDRAAIEAARAAVLEVIGTASDGSPIAGRRWTPRYAASRIAWHALDHAWEMEDRTEPGQP